LIGIPKIPPLPINRLFKFGICPYLVFLFVDTKYSPSGDTI